MAGDETNVVLANNAAFNRRDLEGMLGHYAPDAVVVDLRPTGFGEYSGREAVGAYYGGIFDNTDSITEDMEVLSSADGVVVAHCRTRAALVGSVELDLEYGLKLWVAGGVITRLEVHQDGRAALASLS